MISLRIFIAVQQTKKKNKSNPKTIVLFLCYGRKSEIQTLPVLS